MAKQKEMGRKECPACERYKIFNKLSRNQAVFSRFFNMGGGEKMPSGLICHPRCILGGHHALDALEGIDERKAILEPHAFGNALQGHVAIMLRIAHTAACLFHPVGGQQHTEVLA